MKGNRRFVRVNPTGAMILNGLFGARPTINAPAGPFSINTNYTFTATTALTGATFDWTNQPGVTVVSGQGTSSAVIRFTEPGIRSIVVDISAPGRMSERAAWIGDVSSFSPSTLAGLALWLDASDAGSIVLDGSSNVSQWNDKSGNARHFTQSTTLNRPGYTAGDGLTFTSAGHQLTNATSLNYSSGVSIFIAYRPTSVATYASVGGNDVFADWGGWKAGTGSDGTAWGTYSTTKSGVAGYFASSISRIDTSDRVFSIVANSTNTKARVISTTARNQTLTASTGGLASTGAIGTFPRGNMVIREVIVYNDAGAMTDSDREKVENYLLAKWGTS